MESKSSTKETLTLMVKLGVICIIVAGLLAFVNMITEPVIEENDKTNFEIYMKEVMPDGEKFEEIESDYESSLTGVECHYIYKATKGDAVSGYVVNTICNEGYGGNIDVMVGIKPDKTVNKIKIIALSETAGLGAKSDTPEFMEQYNGLKNGITVEKNNGGNPDNNSISAISGATITSKAVTKAVNCALDFVENGGFANE